VVFIENEELEKKKCEKKKKKREKKKKNKQKKKKKVTVWLIKNLESSKSNIKLPGIDNYDE